MTDLSSAISEITEALQHCAEFSGNITSPPEICYDIVKDIDTTWANHFNPVDAPHSKFSENCQRHEFDVDVKVNKLVLNRILTLKLSE